MKHKQDTSETHETCCCNMCSSTCSRPMKASRCSVGEHSARCEARTARGMGGCAARGARHGLHAVWGGSGVTMRGARCWGARREAGGARVHGAGGARRVRCDYARHEAGGTVVRGAKRGHTWRETGPVRPCEVARRKAGPSRLDGHLDRSITGGIWLI
jgi:hypothetical protein